jgi:putative DNA primase/helicase
MTAGDFAAGLQNCTQTPNGWQASCPAHDDRQASLSIAEGAGGKTLLKCFAGCDFPSIAAAAGVPVADLMGTNGARRELRKPASERIDLEALARDKALPVAFLESLGCSNLPAGGVVVPYLDETARTVATRLRYALKAGDGSRWQKGAKPCPYGLDRLEATKAGGWCVLVEGESDAWTLWHHGFPALGIPGADMAGKLEAEHLEGLPKLALIQEPDKGGATFREGIAARLKALGWAGELRAVPMKDHGHKDPNAWHQADPEGFPTAFRAALAASEVVDLPAPEVDTEPLLAELAALPALEYDRRRQETAKELGIRTATLDAEVERRRPKDAGSERLTGSAVDIGDPEPWPSEVDGALLASELEATFSRYIVLPSGAAVALALWTLHSHAHDAAHVSPILAVTSPEKRCGKTTLLSLLGALTRRPLPVANVTTAALFRATEQWRPALLIDEADTFLKESEDLRGILNSGHTRGAAFVLRVAGDDHEVRRFSTWAPKAVALIGRMHPTLMDRSVEIKMRRRRPEEEAERLRLDRLDDLAELPRRCARWADDHLGALRRADPTMPSGLNDRTGDNWRTLLAIADTLGGAWPTKARAAVVELVGDDDGDEAAGVLLLQDLRDLFKRHGARLPSAVAVTDLATMEERPWPEWHHGKPLTVRQLARLLRPFGIRPHLERRGSDVFRGYREADFQDAFGRYLGNGGSPTVTPLQPATGAKKREEGSVTPKKPVTDGNPQETAPNQRCNAVTVQHPLPLDKKAEAWV